MDLTLFREGLDLIEKGMRKMQGGPMDWYLRKLIECHELLLTKYAPFCVGDRVFLTETPRIDAEKAPGWMHAAHFLVRGATGTVREVSVDGSGFSAQVEFDDESWIPRGGPNKGVPQPTEPRDRSTFGFKEKMLARASVRQVIVQPTEGDERR